MRHIITTLGTTWTPSRARSVQVVGTPWITLCAVLAIGLLAHFALPPHIAAAVLNPMGASLGVAAVAGLRRSRCRAAWNLTAAGVAIYASADVLALLSTVPAMEELTAAFFVASYVALASGFAVFATRLR